MRHPLTPPGLSIGRGTDADLRINDPGVSRLHARIVVGATPQQLRVEDLGSTNGTYVNGRKIDRKERIFSGDVITMGGVDIVFSKDMLF